MLFMKVCLNKDHMIFNLFQKYSAVFSKFLNTLLIVVFIGLEELGLYAFLLASSNIFASIAGLGLRDIFVREFLKKKGKDNDQIYFVLFCEILIKISLILSSLIVLLIINFTNINFWHALSVIFLGIAETSSQMTSQKLRAIGHNTISQLCLNVRPIIVSLSLLVCYFVSSAFLQNYFIQIAVISYLLPAMFFYLYWLLKYKKLFSINLRYKEFNKNLRNFLPELPGLLALSIGNKATSRIDVIFVSSFLGMTAAGMYRLITQLVMIANASIYPIESYYKKKLAITIQSKDKFQSSQIMTKASFLGFIFYICILLPACLLFYVIPFEESIKYQDEFIISLIIVSLTGLVRSLVPLLNSYVVFINKVNKAGSILFIIVLISTMLHYFLVPIYGLVATALNVFAATLVWRIIAMRFL